MKLRFVVERLWERPWAGLAAGGGVRSGARSGVGGGVGGGDQPWMSSDRPMAMLVAT